MTRSMRGASLALVTLLLTTLALPLEAQRPPTNRRGDTPNREQMEQRIRAAMGEMMKRQLGLSDEEAQRLGAVVQEFDGVRRELQREERAIRARVQALILEEAEDPAEAGDLVERLSALRAREAEVFADEQERLLEVLTPYQLLRFHVFREQMGERIRALRQRGGNGDLPGGRGGDFAPGRGPNGAGGFSGTGVR